MEKLEILRSLVRNNDEISDLELNNLPLMTEAELSWYEDQVEMETGELSAYDHFQAVMTYKYRLFKAEEVILQVSKLGIDYELSSGILNKI